MVHLDMPPPTHIITNVVGRFIMQTIVVYSQQGNLYFIFLDLEYAVFKTLLGFDVALFKKKII